MTVLDAPAPVLLPSAQGEAPGTPLPQQVTSCALARAAAILTWGWLSMAPAVIAAGNASYDVPVFLLVLAGMAVTAVVATAIAVRHPDALLRVSAAGLAVVAVGIATFDALMPVRGVPSNPSVSLMATACLVAGLILRSRAAAVTALALALWHSAWDLGPLNTASLAGYLEILLTAGGAVVAGRLVARSLVRSSVQVSSLITRLLERQRAEREDRVRESSLLAARTDLHDTVLTTLSGIGAGWLRDADPQALQAELARDTQMLTELTSPPAEGVVDLSAGLEALMRTAIFDRLDITIDIHSDAGSCPVPAVAADALLLATREALVNVLKHAGTSAATVTVERHAGTIQVTVRDRGRGFIPERYHDGLGLDGVVARLRDAGGWVVVDSAPGEGAMVRLVLPSDGSEEEFTLPALWSREGPRRGALWLTVVAGASQVLSFALQAGGYADPRPQIAALGLALAVDALVVLVLLRRPALPGWLSAVLVMRIPVLLLLTGVPLPGCDAMGYEHFSGGGELMTIIVVALLRPRWEAGVAAALTVSSWAALALPLYEAGESCGITAVANSALAVGLLAASLTLVGALRRHAAIAAEVLATEERLAAARRSQQLRAAERRRLMEVVGGIVTDTLLGLADGRLDPADTQVRRTCRRDARLLRTFLHQAGAGDALLSELFARAVRLRDRGIDLDVRGDLPLETVSPQDRARLLGLVDHWLSRARAVGWSGEGSVTVLRSDSDVLLTVVLRCVPPDTAEATVAVMVPGSPAVQGELFEGDLWASCRVPAHAASAAR